MSKRIIRWLKVAGVLALIVAVAVVTALLTQANHADRQGAKPSHKAAATASSARPGLETQLTAAGFRRLNEQSHTPSPEGGMTHSERWAHPNVAFPIVNLKTVGGVVSIDNIETAPPTDAHGQIWHMFWFQPTEANTQNLAVAVASTTRVRDEIGAGKVTLEILLTPEEAAKMLARGGGGASHRATTEAGTAYLN